MPEVIQDAIRKNYEQAVMFTNFVLYEVAD